MKMRKFLAMLLTLSLVLSLSAPIALAVEIKDENTPAASGPAEENKAPEEEKDPGTESGNPDGDGDKTPGNPDEDGDKTPVNPDGGEEKPPVTETENPDGEKPPVNPDGGEGENKDPANPGEEKPPVNPDGGENKDPANPDEEKPGEPEEPPYFVDEEGNKVDKDGYLVDNEGNQILDENGNPVKAEDKDKVQGDLEDINKPPLTPEEQEALDELGGKADAITGETSREELEAIQNSPLYDRLTEAQKKAVEDALAALALLEQPVIPPVGGTLYERLMAAQTIEEFDAILAEYTEEELAAEWALLTEEQIAALEAHRAALEGEEEPFIPPVEFTDVAPLMNKAQPSQQQTVRRAPSRRAQAARTGSYQEDIDDGKPANLKEDAGMSTSKSLNSDGNMLTIEAWSSGTISITDPTVKGSDVVLVLDQSGSMEFCYYCGKDENDRDHRGGTTYTRWERCRIYDAWSGTCTSGHTQHQYNVRQEYWQGRTVTVTDPKCSFKSRQEVLQESLTVFMNEIAAENAKQTSEDAKCRVAAVRFGGKQEYGFWVNDVRETRSLKVVTESDKAVSIGRPNGGTPTGAAMGAVNPYFSNSGDRNKIVILFTDGEPTGQDGDFSDTEATSAKNAAGALKRDGATVYTIGIFSGANPEGTDKVNQFMSDVSSNSDGKTGYYLTSKTTVGLAEIFKVKLLPVPT